MRKTLLITAITLGVGITYSTETNSNIEQFNQLDKLMIESDGEKLDILTSTWFENFMKEQELGSDLYQADYKATKATLKLMQEY